MEDLKNLKNEINNLEVNLNLIKEDLILLDCKIKYQTKKFNELYKKKIELLIQVNNIE
jgi:cellobiose-specific phosphotransferase system component IIB